MALYRKLTDDQLREVKKVWQESYQTFNRIQAVNATREIALYIQLANQVLNNLSTELARRELEADEIQLPDLWNGGKQ